MMLSRSRLRRIISVVEADTNSFVALTHAAGLDPAKDFIQADLRGVQFGTDDLTGFNFTGSDLRAADFSQTTGLTLAMIAAIKCDELTRWPDGEIGSVMREHGFDLERAAAEVLMRDLRLPDSWTPYIRRLNLRGEGFNNLKLLDNLKTLDVLDLSGSQVTNLDPLGELSFLRTLRLSDTSVTLLIGLAALPRLQSLDLAGSWVSDISPLNSMVSLEVLDLSNTRVDDLGPLAKLKKLRVLLLVNTPVSDLGPLQHLPQLEEIDITGTRVVDFDPLGGLVSLHKFVMNETRLESTTSFGPAIGDLIRNPGLFHRTILST